MALETELATFEQLRAELERLHNGKFVVIRGSELVGAFDTFDAAATDAIRRFGTGPYLIRQVGAPPVSLPASVAFNAPAAVPPSVAPIELAFVNVGR